MRILINAVSAVAGGGMTYLVNLLKYLPDLMPEDEFLAVIQGIQLPEEVYKKPNLTIKKISDKIGSANLFKRYWWENTGLIKLCKLWKADILYCIANMTPLIPAGIPTYTMIQNVAPLTPKVFSLLLKYEGLKSFSKMLANSFLTLYACLHSNKVIVLSHATKQLLLTYLPNVNTSIIYHGINKDSFNTKAIRPINSGKDPYFLFVSNIYVYKGLEYIIEAYKNCPTLPKTFIAGFPFDNKYFNCIKKEIANNNLENKIIFLNSVNHSDLPGWYANAIAMVYTSWCENCPNILLESQACGCPVIAMNIGPMPEFCSKDNILVKPFDGKALADGMAKAIELRKDPDLQKRLLNHSKEFNWHNAMEMHKKVFFDNYP